MATVADLAALYRQIMEDTTMRRIYRRLFMVVLSLALATTTTVATIATPAQATTIANQTGQQKALYQSELEQNLLLRTQLGYGFIAEYGPLRMPPARPYADQTDLTTGAIKWSDAISAFAQVRRLIGHTL